MGGLVTVLIPVYNRQAVLEECILSVMAQTYKNFEIVLVDDGSQDKTPEICKMLCEHYPQIRFFSTEHGGVSVARNKGLDEALGDYVFFIDSDDVIHPTLLEDLVNGLERDNSQMAGCDIYNISNHHWSSTVKRVMYSNRPNEAIFKSYHSALDDFFRDKSPFKNIGGVMIRRSHIGHTRFKTDLFIGEDIYFIYQNLIKGAKCTFLTERRYYCRMHRDNISWNFSFAGFYARFLRRKLIWQNEEKNGRSAYANMQKRSAFGSLVLCLRRNKPFSLDNRKIRKCAKKYKNDLLPAFSGVLKLKFYIAVYFPLIFDLNSKIKKMRSKNKK